MLSALIIFSLLTARNPHPSKVQVSLTRMNHSTNSHEALPSAPQTETEVKSWMPKMTDERISLFHSRMDKSGGPDSCWIWMGQIIKDGYGTFSTGDMSVGSVGYAHRVSYALHKGPIPVGLCVMHQCDNPPCCNPSHLKIGTQAENLKDMYSKGRAPIGVAHGFAKLDDKKVVEIRIRHSGGTPLAKLAKEYGVAYNAIFQVVHRISWKHVA